MDIASKRQMTLASQTQNVACAQEPVNNAVNRTRSGNDQ
jgi:hypothetical protein